MTVIKFPQTLNTFAYNSSKKQRWNTEIQKTGSGRERSMTTQLYPQWEIKAQLLRLSDTQVRELFGFVALRKGAFEPFYWLDPEDSTCTGQQLGAITPGLSYQTYIVMGGYVEPAEYAEVSKVYIDGVEQNESSYSVANGIVTFNNAISTSAVVTADYVYYWKVRFNDDGMGISHIFDNFNSSSSFKLVTVR